MRYLQLPLLVLQRVFELCDAPVFLLQLRVSVCLALPQRSFFSLQLRATFLKGTAKVLQQRVERLNMSPSQLPKTCLFLCTHTHVHVLDHADLVVFLGDLSVL